MLFHSCIASLLIFYFYPFILLNFCLITKICSSLTFLSLFLLPLFRIIDEDEEVEADRNINHLPSLILSDTMKTGLKREFDEVFTKKMIESM